MKTVTTTVYSASELKERFPAAFERALSHWQDHNHEIFWQDETIDSLKECLKQAGVTLKGWSLGAYNRGNHVRVEFQQDGAESLTGKRAFAWLENNLFSSLRVRVTASGKRCYRSSNLVSFKDAMRYHYHVGTIPSCPLTGYCADEDYLDALRKSVRSGDTLKEAFEGLADVGGRLLESEAEEQARESYFLDHAEANEFEFTEDGSRF